MIDEINQFIQAQSFSREDSKPDLVMLSGDFNILRYPITNYQKKQYK